MSQTVQQPTATEKKDSSAQGSQTESKQVNTQDLLKRVSTEPQKVETTQAPEDKTTTSQELLDHINSIQDAAQRKMLMDVYKNMEKGVNKRFMEVADKEKKLTQLESEVKRQQDWTPERINQLLQDPRFVQSAQSLAQSQAPGNWSGTQDEWSALNNTEKAAFQQLEGKVNSLLASQNKLLVEQFDSKIKEKYPDYNPDQINKFAQDFDSGALDTATLRELVHKGLNLEKYVERAHKAGYEDGQSIIQGKFNASTTTGTGLNSGDDKPQMEKGERPQNYFQRLAKHNLEKLKSQTPRK